MIHTDDRARILVVEDDPHIQVLLHYFLRTTFDVEIVAGIDDALDRAAQGPFDLLLLDINLGEDRTGVDLLHAFRQMPAYNATPALAVTAYAMDGDRERFLEQGFDEHVSKPFTRSILLTTIRAYITPPTFAVT